MNKRNFIRKGIILVAMTAALLACSQNKELVRYSSNYEQVLSSSETNNRIDKIIAPYKEKLDKQMNEVLAISEKEIISYRPESELSNYMADMLKEVGQNYLNQNLSGQNVSVSLVNVGGIRAGLPKGEITVRNVFELMPFENELVLLQLSGKQLKTMLDAISRRGGEGVSGCQLVIQNKKATQVIINGNSLNTQELYWVATSDYLASGGDTFHMLSEAAKRVNTGLKIRDLIIDYLKEKNKQGVTVKAKRDGRIRHAK